MKINVLLADGRKLVREGLSLLLEKHRDLHVIGEADGAAAAVKLVRALPVDVVILNLAPPSHGGTDAVGALAAASPTARVLVLSHSPSPEMVQEILARGALGCLTKDAVGAELVKAVRAVASGRTFLSPTLTPRRKGAQRSASSSSAALAPREREILRMIAAGDTTKEIAFALGVSSKTVETHRRRIMLKLDKHSVAELTKYAVLQGISPLENPV